jgi:hypothetical protein
MLGLVVVVFVLFVLFPAAAPLLGTDSRDLGDWRRRGD